MFILDVFYGKRGVIGDELKLVQSNRIDISFSDIRYFILNETVSALMATKIVLK